MRHTAFAAAAAILIPVVAGSPLGAAAVTTPADGYLYARQSLPELTEGCIAEAPGGVFVGVGPALGFPPPGGTRQILFASDSGSIRTVATGLNSISDCVYDASKGLLYVTDSGAEFAGATGGDTVYAIPGNSMAAPVAGMELLPSGSIPQAFGIDLTATGLLVTDATGSGNGSVLAIDLTSTTPSTSTFADGFDYTGGVIVDGARVIVSEALQPNFDSAVYSYASDGTFQSTVAGPGYEQGSIDLAVAADGGILASGSPTLVSIDAGGTAHPLVTGLDGGTGFDAFGGGIAVEKSSGRIDFLASSFSGAEDDRSVHRLVPVAQLEPGGGNPNSDCGIELYGIDLVAPVAGKPARSAICVDGSACDDDGVANGVCRFPLGVCINVADPRLPDCTPGSLSEVELISAKPASDALVAFVDSVNAMLPSAEATCVFGDGIEVPVRSLSDGRARAGKGFVRLRGVTDGTPRQRDTDIARLVCEPAP